MGYVPITDPRLVRKCFETFRNQFSTGQLVQSARPFNFDHLEVRWHKSLGIWTCFGENWRGVLPGDWFALFGVGKPNGYVVASLEINVYKEDPNRRIDGRYFTDETGALLLGRAPTANQGRGTPVPIAALKPEWAADLVTIDWGRRRNDTEQVILIGAFDSVDLSERVAALVKTVTAIKAGDPLFNIAVPSRLVKPASKKPPSFSPEFESESSYDRKARKVVVQHDHAKIVSSLSKKLKKRGYAIANDGPRDLYIPSTGSYAAMLFEIKKANTPQSTYTAIGQLMFHGARQKNTPIRVLVAPGNPKSKTHAALEKLGIEVVTFTHSSHDRFVFTGLDRVLRLLPRKLQK